MSSLPTRPRSGRRSRLIPAFLGLVAAVFTGCQVGGRAWLQQRLMYFPTREIVRTPASIPAPFKDVYFKTSDGVLLNGWFIPNTASSRVVLICHGNGGNISHRVDLCELLHDLGLNVFVFDYRGFGKSEGRPDEQGTYADAMAAFDWLARRSFQSNQIIALGESLGGAVATELATRQELGGLILQSTFTSMTDVGKEVYFFLPVGWLCTFKYDTISKLPSIHCPVLIMHGRQDKLIPFSHAEKLYAAANSPKVLRELPGDHNSALSSAPSQYSQAIREFLNL